MIGMADFAYIPEYVDQPAWPNECLTTLDDLCQKDYNRIFFHKEFRCIDFDKFERSFGCGSQPGSTVDAVMGIAEFQSNHPLGMQSLLVELRFDYQSTHNLSAQSMEEKIRHTIGLLASIGTSPIHSAKMFVFSDSVVQQARSFFSRHRTLSKLGGIPICVGGFLEYVKYIEDYPYIPINDGNSIANDIQQSAGNGKLLDHFDYWLKQTDKYRNHYLLKEAEHIVNTLSEVLRSLPQSDDTALCISVLQDRK